MSDNVIKFRKPEKKPEEPKKQRPRRPLPNWAPFLGLLIVALVIFFVQRGGGTA
ncbi:hypothetical protein [Devosia sediminis]|uniref:Uncharacterized protein n=1 Tax=Devosia sediminis TaxID=2798801 RepID=A0A934MST7_9HYPH|nr:hypothetical protein [Devosia sediminis]MBJ3786769.1 hypothetical protein [Devosia sediminis]